MKHQGRRTVYEESDYGVSRFDYDALNARQLALPDNSPAKVEIVAVAPIAGYCHLCEKDFKDAVQHHKECEVRNARR